MITIKDIPLCIPADPIFPLSAAVHVERSGHQYLSSEKIKAILKGCRLNQREAQKKLYQIFYSYAMSFALRYSSNYDDAVAMTNKAFLRIYRDLKNLVPGSDSTFNSFTGWFKKVVVQTCIDHIRKYAKNEVANTADTSRPEIADEAETAVQMLQHKEIIKCIQQLPPDFKAVFNLYAIEGFSHAEIAATLNISEGTSKSNLDHARINLQQLIKRGHIISYERT